MGKVLKIGIVGCGAIGSSLGKAIVRDFSGQAKLAALYDIEALRSSQLSAAVSGNSHLAVSSLKRLIDKSQLVIEAASAKGSYEIAKSVLARKRDVMLMSVGGVVAHLGELRSLARKKDSRIFIPSGAISGVDAMKAANLGSLRQVVLTTRKNPLSFKGVEYVQKKGIILEEIKEDTLLFCGSAEEAVRHFPQNINVAAVLSLAGLGEKNTQVKIIASPGVNKNIHEVAIVSDAAVISTRTENVLHPDNPKTSFLAVLSAIATLKQILQPVQIGT